MVYFNGKETGKRIKDLRKKKGLTQEQLAKRIQLSNDSISKYECEKAMMSIETLILISQELGVSTDYLLLGKNASTNARLEHLIRKFGEKKVLISLKLMEAMLNLGIGYESDFIN